VHVAQALRCCSPTLKAFELGRSGTINATGRPSDVRSEWLRAQWADVMASVSTCCELEVLVLQPIEVETLFPPGTALARLTQLEICDYEQENPPAVAEGTGLWELMASGGLPALAKLKVMVTGRWGRVQEVRTRVAPALEAVAGTLTRLNLSKIAGRDNLGRIMTHKEGAWYEVGMAVGKLRRLKDLALGLSDDGRAYHAVTQGLAASGGDRPLPLLWQVEVTLSVGASADLLASLLLPTVRVFVSDHCKDQATVLLACALRQAGYKHTWAPKLTCSDKVLETVRVLTQCRPVRVLAQCRLDEWPDSTGLEELD
jgi:hypothetical protein